MKSSTATFSATVTKLGINPVVDPPDDVLARLFDHAGRTKGPIPVRGTINGAEFIQTIVKYKGSWRLYINERMLKDSGADVGDRVAIEVAYDPRPRDVPVPKPLEDALRKDKKARAAFDQLSPSRQKEINRYIGSLKTTGSVDRNVEKIIRHLQNDGADASQDS
jgi:hypothetical protein